MAESQFIESPSFPAQLAWGASGGPRFSTDVIRQYDGTEQRNRNWRHAMGVWDVGSMHRTHAEILLLLEFFYAVSRGQLYSFRFKDFSDYQFSNALGLGDGATQTFQLVKIYAFGAYSMTRVLQKPRAGTLTFQINGVVDEGYDMDFGTGIVTFFTAPPSGALVEGAGEFDVPVRFVQDHLPLRRIDPNIWDCETINLMETRLTV